MANALLAEQRRFGEFVLLPLHVSLSALGVVLPGLRGLQNFAGAIVSMPHKEAIVPLLDEVTPEAQVVGAVNVIRRNASGRLIGTMLDGEGFVAGLRSAGYEVHGKACLLVGAGGAAAAIAFALAKYGCASFTVTNRTESRALTLAARVRATWPGLQVQASKLPIGQYDLAINATSLGMKPTDELPMSQETIENSDLIAECVVAPEITALLEAARQRGRAVHTGVPMLASQMALMLKFMGVLGEEF
jgi:shikimate dehydrogenase